MKKIIALLSFAALTSVNVAMAEEASTQQENFKQMLVKHIDSEIEILSQFKSCIQAAQTNVDFEGCKNARNDAQNKKMAQMKKEQLENQKKRLAMEEKKLDDAAKLEKK